MTLHIRVQGTDSLSIVFGKKHYVQGLGFLNPRRRLLQIRISSPQGSTITYFANMIKQIDYTDSSDPFHSFNNTRSPHKVVQWLYISGYKGLIRSQSFFGKKHYVQGLGFLNPRRRLLQIRISSPQGSAITYFANMIKHIDYTDSSDPFRSFSNTRSPHKVVQWLYKSGYKGLIRSQSFLAKNIMFRV